MTLLKVALLFYLLIFLIFSNLLLLLCNDEHYCLFPVGSRSIHSHFAFSLRQFYSQHFNDLVPLMMMANWVLYLEIVALGVATVITLRKFFWVLAQILGLTWVILYVVYQWSEYRAGNVEGREGWVEVLSFL